MVKTSLQRLRFTVSGHSLHLQCNSADVLGALRRDGNATDRGLHQEDTQTPILPMLLKTLDFNGAAERIDKHHREQWTELQGCLEDMPLYLKASDQAGLKGRANFDPVGTNEHIKNQLVGGQGWRANARIPAEFDFLGKDVDFVSGAMLVEVQFSNYPFLLNNLLRSELLYQAKIAFDDEPAGVLVLIAKAHAFPSSNSTLYFEQAEDQVSALMKYSVFDIPIRLVGLFPEIDAQGMSEATWTEYENPRYSRTVVNRQTVTVSIAASTARGGRRSKSIIQKV